MGALPQPGGHEVEAVRGEGAQDEPEVAERIGPDTDACGAAGEAGPQRGAVGADRAGRGGRGRRALRELREHGRHGQVHDGRRRWI